MTEHVATVAEPALEESRLAAADRGVEVEGDAARPKRRPTVTVLVGGVPVGSGCTASQAFVKSPTAALTV